MQIPARLTDNSTGTVGSTVAAMANFTSVNVAALTQTATQTMLEIPFNSTWSQAQADQVDKNFKEMADQLAAQRTLNTAIIGGIASLTSKVNKLIDLAKAGR